MNGSSRLRQTAALAAIVGVLVQPTAQTLAAGRPAQSTAPSTAAPPPKQAKPAPATTAATQKPAAGAATPIDGGWPRVSNLTSGATVLVYQPQVATWDQQKHMVAFSAVSFRAKTATKPSLGTVKLEANTKVAVAERLVSFSEMKIVEVNFPDLPKEQLREVTAEIDKAIPQDDRVIALDRVLANIDKSQIVPKNVEGVKADPPPIFFSKTPAVIVVLDGEPIWSPIKDNDLKYAVNTNWDLFQHAATNTYYLRNNDNWLKTTDLKTPWTRAGALPDAFKTLPAEDNWKDVKANVPGKSIASSAVPKVFVSFVPGELLRSDVRTQKVAILTSLMELTEAEDKAFWPLYRDYDAEMAKLGDERVALIADYARNYANLTDAVASSLAAKALDLEARRHAVKAKHYERIKAALSPRTALRFLQIEQQLLLIVDLQISAALPIVQ